jgi:signal transduction histidine kinase
MMEAENVLTKKILVVDDKPENIATLNVLLKDFDVIVLNAGSGDEALRLTLENDFALALIDVQMPDMDGYETVKFMRQVEKTKYLPVIFVSAIYAEDYYQILGIEAGAVDFITKPFNTRILLGKVKIFLDLYEQKKRLEMEIEEHKKTLASLLETEKKLIMAKIKAEESDRLKTAFLANMSHEIRTPLTSIVGFSGILSSDNELPAEKKKQFANFIYKSSEGLISLINDILDIAKIESGHFKLTKKVIPLSDVLKDIFLVFQEDLRRKKKTGIELRLKLPKNPVTSIFTDETRFKQVFTNLLGNAVKFTLEGHIEFGYRVKKNELEFYVEDSGIGIPEDKFDEIFDRFQKLNNEKVQNSSGTGIGLSIVKKIVEMLDGRIWIKSEPDKGSKFFFTLPYSSVNDHVQVHPAITDNNSDSVNWSSKNILIVEDEYSTYVLLESLLSSTRARILWAKDGNEAIETCRNNKMVNAVLMDLKMPGMTGLDAFLELKKIDRNIPIVAQTAYAMADEKEYLKEIGFNGCVTKPINKNDLLNILNVVLK